MRDVYLKGPDLAALERVCAGFENVIGPLQGMDGFYYACVRAASEVPLEEPLVVCSPLEGAAVVGLWA